MNLPSVTQAQVLALAGWIVSQAVAYGVLDSRWQSLGISVTATVLAVALHFSDAVIRHGRSRALSPAPPAAVTVVPPAPAVVTPSTVVASPTPPAG